MAAEARQPPKPARCAPSPRRNEEERDTRKCRAPAPACATGSATSRRRRRAGYPPAWPPPTAWPPPRRGTTIPGVRPPQVEHRLDVVVTKGPPQDSGRHLSRSVDPPRLKNAEVLGRLVPAHPRRGKCEHQRSEPRNPPVPSPPAKFHSQSPRRLARGREPAIAAPWQTPRSRTGRCGRRRNRDATREGSRSPSMPAPPCSPGGGSGRRRGPGSCDDDPRHSERRPAACSGRPADRRRCAICSGVAREPRIGTITQRIPVSRTSRAWSRNLESAELIAVSVTIVRIPSRLTIRRSGPGRCQAPARAGPRQQPAPASRTSHHGAGPGERRDQHGRPKTAPESQPEGMATIHPWTSRSYPYAGNPPTPRAQCVRGPTGHGTTRFHLRILATIPVRATPTVKPACGSGRRTGSFADLSAAGHGRNT